MRLLAASLGIAPRSHVRAAYCAALTLLTAAATAVAQVDVTASAGTTNASYTTLAAAFAAINAGVHQGDILVGISGDTVETVSAVLDASGNGTASYEGISISPTGGAARLIAGAIGAGSALVDLNGADQVRIDGLNADGNSLTFANTTVSSVSGTATIAFRGDATNDSVRRVTILGSSTGSGSTATATVLIGGGAIKTGNDAITIEDCDIGPARANLPTKAILGSGSTTAANLYNSGVTVSGNRIFDYFNPAAASHGIYLHAGNADWTIAGNRFFQRATRTQTTGSTHSAIQVASATGNTGHALRDNVIGYASAEGTGIYSLVGAGTSSKFLPIYFSAAGTAVASTVQGNKIAGIAMSGTLGGTGTTGAFVGISIASGLVDVGTESGNTVGSATVPGSIAISHNSTTGLEICGIYFFPSASVQIANNLVAGLTASNAGIGSQLLYGIRVYTAASAVNTVSGNTVGTPAAPITVTGSSTGSRLLGIYCQSGACQVAGNTVSDLSLNAGNPGTAAAASLVGITVDDTGAASGNDIARNTVRNLSNTHGSAAVWVTGLSYAGPSTGTHVVQRNFVHSLTTASSSATAHVVGIGVQAGTTTYRNNMVALGTAMVANGPQISGLYEPFGTDTVLANTIAIAGSGVAGAGASYAFNSQQTTNSRTYRDNVLLNARSNGAGTGKHYAVRVGGTSPNPTGLAIDDNLYWTSGVGGVFGSFNGADVADLAAWRTAVGQDRRSIAADPHLLAPAGSPPDLHVDPAATTPIEGNGALLAAVPDDFDGELRGSFTPADLGADAGNFQGLDLRAPEISFVALSNTSSTANRGLAVAVLDPSGVPVSGLGLPRLYFRKGTSGDFASTACAAAGAGTYDCLVDSSLVAGGGVAIGDTVQYFVAAQDGATVPNVAVEPAAGAAGFAANPPSAATPPTSPANYRIVPPISGTRTVCASGCDYATLTGAGGVFAALNGSVATGNVVIEIAGDLTMGEDGSVALDPLVVEPAGGAFTLEIHPVGAPRAITSTTAPSGGFLRLNGADRVTLDGSLGGVGTDRSLTITDASTSSSGAVIWLQSNGDDGATANVIRNLVVVGQSNTTTYAGIGLGDSAAVPSFGRGNHGNTIRNNAIRQVQYGIYALGESAAARSVGNAYSDNSIAAVAPANVAKIGIYVGFEDGVEISRNTVSGPAQTGATDVFGISLGLTSVSTSTYAGNEVTNARVTGNVIGLVRQTGTYSAIGIGLAPAASGTTLVANNFVHGVGANATSGDFGAGIFLGGGSGSTTRVAFNSVALTGTLTGGSYPSYALAIGAGDPAVELRDNVLFATLVNGTGVSYAIGTASPTWSGLSSDHNILYVPPGGGTFKIGKVGSLSAGSGSELATLGDWQATTGKDLASLAVDPLFVSTADLHLQLGSPALDAGVTFATVTDDIDGDRRPAVGPDLGADEIVQADLSITKTDGVDYVLAGGTTTYTITATNLGHHDVSGALVSDSFPAELACTTTCLASSGASCTPGPFPTGIQDTVSLPLGASVTYTSVCTVNAGAVASISNSASITPPAGVNDPQASNNLATDLDLIGSPAADLWITKSDGAATAVPGGTLTYTIAVGNLGPTAAVGARVTDDLPAHLACTTTCVGAGGGSCTLGPVTTDIDDTVDLPVGASVTYSSICIVNVAATGSVRNSAEVAPPSGLPDPSPANNRATDEDLIAGNALFVDGFESGGLGPWGSTSSLSEPYRVLAIAGGSAIEAAYDFAGLPGEAFGPNAIAEARAESGRTLWRLLARRLEAGVVLQLALERSDGSVGDWRSATGSWLRFDWSLAAEGQVAVTIDGRLVLWLAGFAFAETPVQLDLVRLE